MTLMKQTALAILVLLLAACANSTDAPEDSVAKPDTGGPAAELILGKRVYEVHCLRCHGADGKDETYPFIARLDGIGRRMSVEEILEATWASGFVSPRSMSEAERQALGRYVATL